MVKLNVFPMIQLTKLFLPILKKFEKSFILNMSSLGSLRPIPYKALYSASKAFIYFSRAISSELKEDSVYVSVSCPAGVYTNEAAVKRIKVIDKSFGKWTSLNTNIVAKYIVNGMLNGKRLIIPGVGAKFLMVLMKLLPEKP